MFTKAFILSVILSMMMPMSVYAQSDYGTRVRSMDGAWLLPVASRLLGSTDGDHLARNSINSWDVSASVGTPVFAAASGVVKTSGCFLYEKHITSNLQGYGCSVQIDHGSSIVSQYGHCLENSLQVAVGQQVTQSTVLCAVGRTGKTGWPHVHFTILKGGVPVPIANVFDIRQMRYCKFCWPSNDPGAQIVNSTASVTGGRAMPAFAASLLQAMAAQSPEVLASVLAVVLFVLLLIFWLGGLYVRVGMLALGAGASGAIVIVVLFFPQPVTATPAPAGLNDDPFSVSYTITRGREGVGCDNYIVRTLNGVTQWTYNRYNAERGIGQRDVCTYLTEGEARDIYYRYYWIPSGAANLSIQSAVTAFDHAINAGNGEAKRIIAACGDNAACLNQQRVAFYRSTATCQRGSSVCGAWLRRVQHIMSVTGIQ